MPLADILVDFNDRLKSMTKGYGSMDYEHAGYRAANMVKMDMLIAGDPVEAFPPFVRSLRLQPFRNRISKESNERDRQGGINNRPDPKPQQIF